MAAVCSLQIFCGLSNPCQTRFWTLSLSCSWHLRPNSVLRCQRTLSDQTQETEGSTVTIKMQEPWWNNLRPEVEQYLCCKATLWVERYGPRENLWNTGDKDWNCMEYSVGREYNIAMQNIEWVIEARRGSRQHPRSNLNHLEWKPNNSADTLQPAGFSMGYNQHHGIPYSVRRTDLLDALEHQ